MSIFSILYHPCSLWFIIIMPWVFFHLSKLLLSGFFQYKGYCVCGSKYSPVIDRSFTSMTAWRSSYVNASSLFDPGVKSGFSSSSLAIIRYSRYRSWNCRRRETGHGSQPLSGKHLNRWDSFWSHCKYISWIDNEWLLNFHRNWLVVYQLNSKLPFLMFQNESVCNTFQLKKSSTCVKI